MKDPVQKKETTTQSQEHEGEKTTAGASKTPPSFSVGAGAIQKKEDPKKAAAKPQNKQDIFVSKFAASAIALESKEGVPALFTLAQGALESGWGEKAIGNALFGIKAGANWKGKKQLVVTTEYFKDDKQGDRFPETISITKMDDGRYKYKVKDWFRDYETVEEGLADHSRFLIVNKRYAGAFNTETPEEFARAVAAAGYATDATYADTLVSMIKSVKKHWSADAGSIPAGNAKAITGGKPGGATPTDPKVTPKPETKPAGGQTTPAKPTTVAPGKANAIQASVGERGVNDPADALIVKGLLIKAGYGLTNTPDIGPKTIGFIKDYQSKALGWKNPDGLVEPGGGTFNALLKGQGLKPADGVAKPKTTTTPVSGYASMAEQLHKAMFATTMGMDLGTDEAAIYAVLGKLNREVEKINALKAAYKNAYQRDLAADLRSELSDSMVFGPELSKAIDLITPKASPAVKGDSKTVTPPVKTGTNETKPATQTAGSTGSKLDQFYNDFSHIKVQIGEKVVVVTPPYHINAFDRVKRSNAARADNPAVITMVDKLIKAGKVAANAKVGKSQPADIKAILEQAVTDGLTTHDASSMQDFLSKYGLSVDCSGYVSQALNFLMDGNQTVDKKDKLQPGETASGSLKGGTTNFDKVDIADVQSGDTMHLDGHIRIINEVVKEDKIVFFRTAESTAANNKKTNMNGIMTRWWKYEGGKKYTSWENQTSAHPKSDDKSWTLNKESNTFGRYKSLPK
jgi:flagellum-specific peptidoglycan hydrolase FlgJ